MVMMFINGCYYTCDTQTVLLRAPRSSADICASTMFSPPRISHPAASHISLIHPRLRRTARSCSWRGWHCLPAEACTADRGERCFPSCFCIFVAFLHLYRGRTGRQGHVKPSCGFYWSNWRKVKVGSTRLFDWSFWPTFISFHCNSPLHLCLLVKCATSWPLECSIFVSMWN